MTAARVLFITGFNRSGTTLLTSAVTEAEGARTLTTGDLARHIPSMERFLESAARQGTVTDRGVDRLPVTSSTPEEYCWFLNAVTGDFAFGPEAARTGVLRSLIDELADGQHETVVLKNPWDTGRERLLLDNIPGSRVLMIRRDLSAIEDSQIRAWDRMATSNRYVRALIGDRRRRAEFLGVLLDAPARRKVVTGIRRRNRKTAVRLARAARKLPADRVAFLSYDELRADPATGAAWAAHLADPEALAAAIAEQTFPEYNRPGTRSVTVQVIDWYWARAWRRARNRQVRAGILTRPDLPEPRPR